jgi:thiamine-monophosphate kinase
MIKTVADVGEFGLIRLIREVLPPPSATVLLGIGDDAAIVLPSQRPSVITTDAMIEDVHFRLDWCSAVDIAHKALASNISDLAAKCAQPSYGVISVGLPPSTPLQWVEELYRTLVSCSHEWHCEIIGGDTVRSEKIMLSITVWGELLTPSPVRISGAHVGDIILVTGFPGDAAAGLHCFETETDCAPESVRYLKQRFLRPTPRIREMNDIIRLGLPSSMTDISDGLAREISKLCHASQTGAEIDLTHFQCSPALQDMSREDPTHYVWKGGEDYELLFTLPATHAETMLAAWSHDSCPLQVIGEIRPSEQGIVITGVKEAGEAGFDHFT